jgi:methylenetetrahydrofolate reductase (NADPH)
MAVNNGINISFELFPVETEEGLIKLGERCEHLNKLTPHFFSITCGAAGSSQWKTQRLVHHLSKSNIELAPHISCITMTKSKIAQLLEDYIQLGINRLVVIRGDHPANGEHPGVQDFIFANELVRYIRKITDDYFHISVAAYPEFHPEAVTPLRDLENFKRKVEAGANNAITQCFFNSDAYFQFLDSCENLAISIPIVPGILPITDYNRLLRFSKTCGVEIPLWLRKRLEQYQSNIPYLQDLGIEITTKLCEQLLNGGVKHLHFYTLNQTEPTTLILKNLQHFSVASSVAENLGPAIVNLNDCVPAPDQMNKF